MTPEPRVAVVVVAYNGGYELLECVRSLLAQTVRDLEVLVVDNASTDGSIERLEAAFGGDIRVVRRATNGGYAAGANTGWRATDAPIVVVANQDMTFVPDCLEQMERALLAHDGEALVTPKIVMKSDPARVNAIGNDVHVSGVAWCHGLGTWADDWHGVVEVTAISGAAFMAPRSVLDRLSGLEEAYFMYMEDVDLSLRARISGIVSLAACDAVATHDWSLSLTPWKFALLERNRRNLWRRFIGPSRGLWLALVQAEAMAWAYAALHGREFATAKWRVRRTSLPLESAWDQIGVLLPYLSRRHPYEVLFPESRLVALAGGAVDTVVGWYLRAMLRRVEPLRRSR